jgi:UDP-glucose 4-epimerase
MAERKTKRVNRVLVTGGCGFIGRALTNELLKRGYEVDVIDNISIGSEAVIPEGCTFLRGDIRAMDSIEDYPYKYIFHLAALSRIQPSFEKPFLTFSINVDGTRQAIEYAERNGSKLIFASSSSIHNGGATSPYTMSKLMGEQWCKLYAFNYGLNVHIARLYNVYGEDELVNSHMAAVIGLFRRAISKGEPMLVHGNGKQRRDFTHIGDTIDGLIRIAEYDNVSYEIWELGTGSHYSINDVFDMFQKRFPQLEKKFVADVDGNYRDSLCTDKKAVNILGWEPLDKLKEYINTL